MGCSDSSSEDKALPEGRMVGHLSIQLTSATTFPYHLSCTHLLIQQILSQHFLCARYCAFSTAFLADTVVPRPNSLLCRINFPNSCPRFLFQWCPKLSVPKVTSILASSWCSFDYILEAREPTLLVSKLISQDNQSSSCFLPSLLLPVLSVPPPSTDSASVDLIIPSGTLIGRAYAFPYSGNSEILPSLLSSSDNDLSTYLSGTSTSPWKSACNNNTEHFIKHFQLYCHSPSSTTLK